MLFRVSEFQASFGSTKLGNKYYLTFDSFPRMRKTRIESVKCELFDMSISNVLGLKRWLSTYCSCRGAVFSTLYP